MTELLIVFVVSDGVQLMDIAGPADVFAEANTFYGRPLYRSVLVAAKKDIRSSCGFNLRADLLLGDIGSQCVDTLLVAGAPDAATRSYNPALTRWLRQEAPKARRFGSICGGVFPLAETGLLDGQTIATHWADVDRVRHRFPAVTVDADALCARKGLLELRQVYPPVWIWRLRWCGRIWGSELPVMSPGNSCFFTNDPEGNCSTAGKGNCPQPGGLPCSLFNGRFCSSRMLNTV